MSDLPTEGGAPIFDGTTIQDGTPAQDEIPTRPSAPQGMQRNMRTFLLIWSGQVISMVGSGLTSFAVGVWLYQQTGQATPLALTYLFANLPRLLLTPYAGSLADRWSRRWVMVLADSGSAMTTLSLVALLSIGELQTWHVYLLVTISSAFSAFQEPAYTASISMLVPKDQLARASGLSQMGQAAEMLISPLLAGLLFGVIGLQGIILVDFVTFFFAVGALLLVDTPQPDVVESGEGKRGKVWRDATFGWNYLRTRPGLFGMLVYFALVNFLLNFSVVLTVPLVLSFGTPGVLGVVQMTAGLGMLAGSIVMSAWGGPRRRILAVIGFITLAGAGLLVAGLRSSALFVGAGMFILLFCIPLASAPSQAIFQTKIAPGVQGRVFAIRSMISRSMMPLAFLLAGPLADRIFEPLMQPGGALATTFLGTFLGSGPGRGIGLMFLLSGLTLLAASLAAYSTPRIRLVESDLPDVLPES
jgi:DHA3 family macrolide efflux protein-like MFS transporter